MSDADLGKAMEIRSKVQGEADLYQRMLESVRVPGTKEHAYILAIVPLLIISTVVLIAWSEALVLWVIVTFFLYSFNYLVFFLPITRHPGWRRKRERPTWRSVWSLIWYLLRERRGFAIEMGLTMFLVGMVPLARSFFVLFGFGLVFTLYHGMFTGELPMGLTVDLIVQILVIMGYLVMVVTISPQTQGFTQLVRDIKLRVRSARSKGMAAYAWALVLSSVLAVAVSLVAAGAILLPGKTIDTLNDFLQFDINVHILAFVVMLVAEFFVMRALQSRGSRHMALALIERKAEALRVECLVPLDALIAGARACKEVNVDKGRFEKILCDYYQTAIYDVVETNLLGRMPVFLVVPNTDLLLDREALRYVGVPRDLEGRPVSGDCSKAEA